MKKLINKNTLIWKEKFIYFTKVWCNSELNEMRSAQQQFAVLEVASPKKSNFIEMFDFNELVFGPHGST